MIFQFFLPVISANTINIYLTGSIITNTLLVAVVDVMDPVDRRRPVQLRRQD